MDAQVGASGVENPGPGCCGVSAVFLLVMDAQVGASGMEKSGPGYCGVSAVPTSRQKKTAAAFLPHKLNYIKINKGGN
ncbi:uncharacterized [Tachysurus ichikawai]